MQTVVDQLKKENKQAPSVPTVQNLKGVLSFESEAAASEALRMYGTSSSEILPKATQSGKNLDFAFSTAQIREVRARSGGI